MTEIWHHVWLCLSAFAAGVINAVAGGGTLVTFPMLIWVLGNSPEQSVAANATSTFALFPGSLASMWGYRREIGATAHWLKFLLLPSIIGGVLGAMLTLYSPAVFKQLIPWLILTAALLFLFQPLIARGIGIGQPHAKPTSATVLGIIVLQFLIAVYGGYFGAGIGILMLSVLGLMGMSHIHEMNAVKTVIAAVINLVATLYFVGAGLIEWPQALVMTAGATAGYFSGSHFAQRVSQIAVRRLITAIGFTISAVLFWRQFA
jgi:uncharacterized membrane protein YfcA